jgi:hypothetical protein
MVRRTAPFLPLTCAAALAATGCDLSFNNSAFTCDGTTPCPNGLSCISGSCQVVATSGGGTTGTATSGSGTSGTGTTGSGSGSSSSGGTTGAPICTNPPSGLCPPDAGLDLLSCEFGCCPQGYPYACGYTATCYASADNAAVACADAGQGCSTCVSQWCGSPPPGTCVDNSTQGYCGGSVCCPLTNPWFCAVADGGDCYQTQAEALTHCGNACSYCTPPCTPTPVTGSCAGGVTCSSAPGCCPAELPFYCPATGYCFASNAEAYLSCQGTCTACAP